MDITRTLIQTSDSWYIRAEAFSFWKDVFTTSHASETLSIARACVQNEPRENAGHVNNVGGIANETFHHDVDHDRTSAECDKAITVTHGRERQMVLLISNYPVNVCANVALSN